MIKEKSQKQLQIGEQIKREIANIFLRDDIFKSDNFKLTIYEADASPDLKNVKIFVNIFGDIEKKKLLSELNKNSYYFRQKLSKRLKLKNIPQIKFILDQYSDNVDKISKRLKEEGEVIAGDKNKK